MTHREIFICIFSAVFIFNTGAARAGEVSGVSGRISQAPISSGAERVGHEPDAAPLVNVYVWLRDSKMDIVAQARTDSFGRYAMRAPAGAYTLLVDIKAKLPRCEITPVTVRPIKISKVDIECDSGMR